MKSILRYAYLMLAAVLQLTLVSCSDDEPVEVPPGQLTLDKETVEVGSTGGRAYITYSLANVGQDAQVSASTDADWIKDIDTEVDGRIAFSVDANVSDQPREAVVTVSCTGAEDASFIVKQTLADDYFTFEPVQASEITLTAKITPKRDDMRYLVMIIPKSQMDNYKSDEEIYVDDIVYMKEYADKLSISFQTLLNNYSKTGVQELTWSDLSVETPYCIYAYGIDSEGRRLTSISKYYMSTTKVQETPVSFDIEYVVDGPVINMFVTPSDDEVMYYYNILEADTSDDEIRAIVQNNLDQIVNQFLIYGYTLEQAVEATCYTGQSSDTFSQSLLPEHEYVGFAMAVSKSGRVSSKITRKNVTTGKVPDSSNVLDIKVSDIKSRTAYLAVTPSNNDTYVLTLAPYSYYGDMEDNLVTQYISAAVTQGLAAIGSGAYEGELTGLEPDTEYEVLAVGMVGTYPTTKLFRHRFKTNAAGETNISLNVEVSKYFAASDAAQKWPGQGFEAFTNYAIVPVSVSTDGAKVYYTMYQEDLTGIDDNLIINDLVQNGYSTPIMNFFAPYEADNTLCAVAEDAQGNYSKVYRKTMVCRRDGVSPIDEFDFSPSNVRKKAPGAKAETGFGFARRGQRVASLMQRPVQGKRINSRLVREDIVMPDAFKKNIMLRRLPDK